jgi:predicted nucleotidyltransferase
MLSKEQVLETLKQNKHYLFEKYFVKEVGLFGSFSRDQQTADSDIDLLLEIDSTNADLYELKKHIRSYLSQLFNRKVEVARKKYLKPYIREDILNEVIYV